MPTTCLPCFLVVLPYPPPPHRCSIDAFGDILAELRRDGKAVVLLGFHARVRTVITKAHWFHEVHTFPHYGALLAWLRETVESGGDYHAPPAHEGGDHGGHKDGKPGGGATAPAVGAAPVPGSVPSTALATPVAGAGSSQASAFAYQAMLLSPSPAAGVRQRPAGAAAAAAESTPAAAQPRPGAAGALQQGGAPASAGPAASSASKSQLLDDWQ